VSGRDEIVLGAVSFLPALMPTMIDNMAQSIADLLVRNAELEAERDFYKAAATKLMKPRNGRRKK
jgi:hypothetical protein